MKKSAIISDCGLYRYQLSRVWDTDLPKVLFIMLNPSTADATFDDPTIRRCIGFAKSWGYGGLLVGNLFAFRATKPKDLLKAEDPVGKDNIRYLQEMFSQSEIIICAWGNSKIVDKISKRIGEYRPLSGILGKLAYLELSKDETPKHPLYLRGNLQPTPLSFFQIQ